MNFSTGSGQIVLGDLYRWELDNNGFFVVEENDSQKLRSIEAMPETDFKTMDLGMITEDIKDE
jgi:hypothetical protein